MKDRIKYFLDFIPLLVLIVCAIILLWTVARTNIVLQFEHYLGIIFLIITVGLFILSHKLGVVSLGITILLGIFKVLSLSPVISAYSFGGSLNGYSIGGLKIQTIFILWLIIHLVLSSRYYKGIATKKYWQTIFNGQQS